MDGTNVFGRGRIVRNSGVRFRRRQTHMQGRASVAFASAAEVASETLAVRLRPRNSSVPLARPFKAGGLDAASDIGMSLASRGDRSPQSQLVPGSARGQPQAVVLHIAGLSFQKDPARSSWPIKADAVENGDAGGPGRAPWPKKKVLARRVRPWWAAVRLPAQKPRPDRGSCNLPPHSFFFRRDSLHPAKGVAAEEKANPAFSDIPMSTSQRLGLVEDLLLAEHVEHGPSQFGREDRQDLGFAAFFLVPFHPRLGPVALPKPQAHRLAEGPTQMGVADLFVARALLFAGRLVAAPHQSRVRQKLAHFGKAANVVDLVKEDQGQDFADAGDRPQPGQRVGIVHLGVAFEVQFELVNAFVELVDQFQVGFDGDPDRGVFESLGHVEFLAIAGKDELFAEGGMVVLAIGVLDVGDEVGTLADEEEPAAEQIASFAEPLGIHVGGGKVAAAEEGAEFIGIELVVFGFAAVDGFEVEGVAQDERDLVQGAQVREPVPGEHAFAANDESVAEWLDGREKSVGLGGEVLVEDDVAVGIANAEVHRPGMKIDAAVESVWLLVEPHH